MKRNRFVIQEHETPDGVHWDLMLERNDILMTFRLEETPQETLRHPIEAVKIFDHPLRFLSYEGPVQQGTGRVRIVDRGTYRLDNQEEDLLVLEVSGTALRGSYTLGQDEDAVWRLTFVSNP